MQISAHATVLTEEQIALCHEVFALFDRDKDGSITEAELGLALRQLGQSITDEEAGEQIKIYDSNGDERLDFNEFLKLMQKKLMEAEDDAEVDEVFDIMCHPRATVEDEEYGQSTEEQYITPEKLKTLTGYLGLDLTDKEVNEMISLATNDGVSTDKTRVTREQFFKIITNRERRSG